MSDDALTPKSASARVVFGLHRARADRPFRNFGESTASRIAHTNQSGTPLSGRDGDTEERRESGSGTHKNSSVNSSAADSPIMTAASCLASSSDKRCTRVFSPIAQSYY